MEFGPPPHGLRRFRQITVWHWHSQGLGAVFVLALAIQVLLGLTLRGLYADGAYFVTQIAAQQNFYIAAPARWVSSIVLELPSIAAIKLGIESPNYAALIFSVFTNVLPGAVFLLCRAALPTTEGRYFIFPAFVYFAGVLSAQFASVTEGLFSTAYVWLLFYLILFGRLSPVRLGLILLLSVGSIRLHEETAFLAAVVLSAVWLRRRDATSRTGRIVLYLILFALLVSAFVGAYWSLYPANPLQRASLIRDFEDLAWLYVPGEGCNLPAALGLTAGLAILVCVGCPRFSRITAITFSVAAICLAICSFWVEALTLSYAQFAARHNAGLLSFPLMIVALAARFVPEARSRLNLPSIYAIVMGLGVSASLWHIQATEKWSGFLSHFRNVLTSHNGIVPFMALLDPPDSSGAKLTNLMAWRWTNPELSILALPRECIGSVVDNPPGGTWQSYRLQNPETLPRFPGVTYTYLLPPEMRAAACRPVNPPIQSIER